MISKVIVGVDFSNAAKTALVTGKFWAERLRVPLVALHVVHVPTFFMEESYVLVSEPDWVISMTESARKRFYEWAKGVGNVSLTVVLGSPAEQLVAAADPNSLLVVGQIGHSNLEHLLFGSTAARVARHAPCDVLVVRESKDIAEKAGAL